MANRRSALGTNHLSAAAIGRDALIPAPPPAPAPAEVEEDTSVRVALYMSRDNAEYLRDVVVATGRTYTMGSLVDEALAAYWPTLENKLNEGQSFPARPVGSKMVTGPAVRARRSPRQG